MKASLLIFSPLLLLPLGACKQKSTVATVPVATEVSPADLAPADNSFRPDGTPRRELKVAEAPVLGAAAPVVVTPKAPAAIPVPDEDDAATAAEVDEEEPMPRTPGEHVDHAIQKTDEGIRKGLDATGRFLQRAGEKIEDESRKNAPQPPPPPRN